MFKFAETYRLINRTFLCWTFLLTTIKNTLLLRSVIVVFVQQIGNRKHRIFKVIYMKNMTKYLGLLAVFMICNTTSAQQADNPHSLSLAAVRAGNLVKLQNLIEQQGANMNSRNRTGESLLMMAIKGGQKDIIAYLLSKDANVNVANTAKVTPLMAAAYAGDIQTSILLLNKDADINAVDQLKKPAIVYAAGIGNAEIVDLLLARGIDINARYPNDLTVLMWAAGAGHANTVKLLLAKGADAGLQDNRGKTALQMAEDSGHLDVIKLLKRS